MAYIAAKKQTHAREHMGPSDNLSANLTKQKDHLVGRRQIPEEDLRSKPIVATARIIIKQR